MIAARFCGSAKVPPPVATTTWRGGSWSSSTCALDGAEVRLAVLREDLGDRLALALLDQLVDVAARQPRRRASARATVRLAGGHEADQVDLVGLHATSRPERLEEAGVGDGDGVGAVDGGRAARAASAAMANAIAMR